MSRCAVFGGGGRRAAVAKVGGAERHCRRARPVCCPPPRGGRCGAVRAHTRRGASAAPAGGPPPRPRRPPPPTGMAPRRAPSPLLPPPRPPVPAVAAPPAHHYRRRRRGGQRVSLPLVPPHRPPLRALPPFPLGPWRRGARWPCPPARAAAAGGTTAAAAVAAGRRDWPPVAQTVDGRRWGVGVVGGGVAEAAPVWGGGGVWGLSSFRTRRGGDARASASVSPRWRQQRRRALLRCHSLNDGGTPFPPSRPAPPRPRTTNAPGRDDGHGMRARRGADPSRGVDVVDADTEAPRVVLHGPHGGWPMGVGGGPPRGK